MKDKGFTLVEMMVVTLILAMITLVLTNYLLSERKSHENYDLQLRTRNNVFSTLNIIAHDLRTLGSDPEFTGSFGFLKFDGTGLFETNDTAMLFICDVNPDPDQLGDGIWDPKRETFGFYRSGDTLMRPYIDISRNWYPDSSERLVERITNLSFLYYLEDGSTVNNPTAAQLPLVLAIDVTATSQSPRPLPGDTTLYTFTGQTRVTIRPRL